MTGNASASGSPTGADTRMINGDEVDEGLHESSDQRETAGTVVTKQQWRTRLLTARRARQEDERAAARARITEHLLAAFGAAGPPAGPGPTGPLTVCAFHPLPTEPPDPRLPVLLAQAGLRVLVPVARPNAPLDWCEVDADGPLARGMLGVPEPTGPRLGPPAIRGVQAVLIPALAVDATGVRLGRGGGHYDRSLALLGPGDDSGSIAGPRPRLIAVVFDDELVTALPHDPHDIPVTDVLTPGGGLRPLPGSVVGHVAPAPRRGASSN